MSKIPDLLSTIGNTPLVMLQRLGSEVGARIAAKIEGFNPGGSVKDRIALSMIEDAERKGLLRRESRVIEATSGNTGIGLALVCAVKGYKLTITMPESMSMERIRVLEAFGTDVVLTPAERGMSGAIELAYELATRFEHVYMPQQFKNPSNPDAHYHTTGPEIWRQTAGEVDVFVAGVGTGGTISGTGRYLKEMKGEVRIVAVEPEESAVLSGGPPGTHMIEGIGAGFVPDVYDAGVVDRVVSVSFGEAVEYTRRLAEEEGIFAGISSGAALAGAIKLSKYEPLNGKLIVVLLPDRGEKYLSTELWKGY